MPLLNPPRIILENPKYSGNIGMICRLVANFGLEPPIIIGEPIHPSEEMKWMAKHSNEELEKLIYTSSYEEATSSLDLLIGTGMIHGGKRSEFLTHTELFETISEKKFGIIFGREDKGLSKVAISYCDYMLDFQLPGYQKSMNLSHSVSFILGMLYNVPISKLNNLKSTRDTRHFFIFAKKIFSYLGLNSFQNVDNLAVRRFKSILNRTDLTSGDVDFFYKIFHSIENLYLRSQNKDQ